MTQFLIFRGAKIEGKISITINFPFGFGQNQGFTGNNRVFTGNGTGNNWRKRKKSLSLPHDR